MQILRVFYCVTIVSAFYIPAALAGPCTSEDKRSAEFWQNYYSPEEAFDFGETIKKLVEAKNLRGLFDLVDGELASGPRKEFVQGKEFSDVFSDKWRQGLLESVSPCSPIGWRGFVLDSGSIWYSKNREKDKWHIFSILGAKEEIIDSKMLIGWQPDGRLIPPQYFSTKWMSGDNYKDFADKFMIKNYRNFAKNPGLYFGKEITNFDPIISSWDAEIYLATSMKKCFQGALRFGRVENIGFPTITTEDGSVETEICSSKDVCTKFAYTILAEIPTDKCNKLAKHVEGECLTSYLISIGDYSGGTMGWNMSYNIYGLFSLRDDQRYLLPLKNFDKKNDAINYIK